MLKFETVDVDYTARKRDMEKICVGRNKFQVCMRGRLDIEYMISFWRILG